jgi:REP element-mobilizing transposase RayT
MPSKPRPFYPGGVYHIYNRGSQKMTLFHNANDYGRFILKACEYKTKHPVDVLAYCIMPNHFHFILREPENPTRRVDPNPKGRLNQPNISRFLHLLSTAYAKYYGLRHSFSGRVFGQPFNAKHILDDSYFMTLVAYIHDNPVRAKLADTPAEWPYSSYLDLIGRCPDELTTSANELFTDTDHRKNWQNYARNRDKSYATIANLI